MTTKLTLGPIAKAKADKRTLAIAGELMHEISDYAWVYARLPPLAAPLPPEKITLAMAARFIAGDREFSKQRRRS